MKELIKNTQVCIEVQDSVVVLRWSMEIAGEKYGSYFYTSKDTKLEKVIGCLLMQVEGIINGVMALPAGKWEMKLVEKNGVAEMKAVCNLCGMPNKQYTPPYCPHCGAKMDGDT
jgi:hypothetical protein